MMYMGGEGLYTFTFEYEKKDDCPVCGSSTQRFSVNREKTLEELIEQLATMPSMFSSPSLLSPRINV